MTRIAVTMEDESWIIRRLAERFQAHAGPDCEVIPVLARTPLPDNIDAVLYSDWPHCLLQPPEMRKKVPAVLMVHHIDRFAFRLRMAAMRPDVIVTCMSRRWIRFFRRWTFPVEKLKQVHYGVDLNLFQPADALPASPEICIGVVGRLYPGGRKGEDRLLAIARQLPPHRFRFQFMGERWDEIVARLVGMGFQVGVAHRCQESEQPEIYRRMDCLLVCSRNEGGPLPVLEALASGVPVVSSDVGFLPELEELFPFAVKIYGSNADAVNWLMQGKQLRAEAQRQSARLMGGLEIYSWPRWAGEMKGFLLQAAAQRSRH